MRSVMCDYCGRAARSNGDLPGDWWALGRHEGEESSWMGPPRPTETRREFCSDECVRGWITNKSSLAEAMSKDTD